VSDELFFHIVYSCLVVILRSSLEVRALSKSISLKTLFVIVVAILYATYEFFLRTFLGSLAQQIIATWHLDVLQFSNLSTAYYLTYGIMQIPVGLIVGRYGVRLSLIFSSLLLVVSTLLFANNNYYSLALIARVLMAIASSFAFICLFVLVMNCFAKRHHGLTIGLSQFITTMGPLLAGGPLIVVIHHYHLAWQFAIDCVGLFGLVFFILAFFLFTDNDIVSRKKYSEKKDEFLSWRKQIGILFSNKQGLIIAVYSGLTYVPVVVLATFWGTRYLQTIGFSQSFSSSMISLVWFSMALACPIVGWLSDNLNRRKLFFVLCSVCGLLSSTALLFISIHSALWFIFLIFIGLGVAVSAQCLGYVAVVAVFKDEMRSAALGLNNTGVYVFNVLVPYVVSLCISKSVQMHGDILQRSDFYTGFSILPILYFVAFVVAFLFIRDKENVESSHLVSPL
jgi:MFS family permease